MELKKIYTGLNAQEVAENRKKYGENLLTPPAQIPLWKRFITKFKDPLIIILLVAGVLSIAISFYEYHGLHEGTEVFFEPVGIFIAILLAQDWLSSLKRKPIGRLPYSIRWMMTSL